MCLSGCREEQRNKERSYRTTQPRPKAAPAALTADFLEEEDGMEYEGEEEAEYASEDEGARGGVSATDRARALLGSSRRHYDEQEEVSGAEAVICCKLVIHLKMCSRSRLGTSAINR
jgi:hypothetical protein